MDTERLLLGPNKKSVTNMMTSSIQGMSVGRWLMGNVTLEKVERDDVCHGD